MKAETILKKHKKFLKDQLKESVYQFDLNSSDGKKMARSFIDRKSGIYDALVNLIILSGNKERELVVAKTAQHDHQELG